MKSKGLYNKDSDSLLVCNKSKILFVFAVSHNSSMEQVVIFSTFLFCIPYFYALKPVKDWSIFYLQLTVFFVHYSCNVLCLYLSTFCFTIYCYLSISTSNSFLFCPDILGPAMNYYHSLLQVGNYMLSYLGIISSKHRCLHILIFVNVVVTLQFSQSAFLKFWKWFSGRFPDSSSASITEYTIGFDIS